MLTAKVVQDGENQILVFPECFRLEYDEYRIEKSGNCVLLYPPEMNLKVKRFHELSTDELYRILKLRVDVFVVEQNCPYAELDDLDRNAIHVWLEDSGDIVAYLRVMDRGVESDHVSIGRLIAARRRCGLGTRILREGIRVAREAFNADAIYIEAQVYAKELYAKQGFRTISDEFLLDGIPHVKMQLDFAK